MSDQIESIAASVAALGVAAPAPAPASTPTTSVAAAALSPSQPDAAASPATSADKRSRKIIPRPDSRPVTGEVDLNYRKGWKDDMQFPGRVRDKMLTEWCTVEDYWKDSGYPCANVISDDHGPGQFLTVLRHGPTAKDFPATKAEADVEFIPMRRVIGPGQEDNVGPIADALVTYHMAGSNPVAIKRYTIVVPRDKVEEYVEAGWDINFGVPSAFTKTQKIVDTRERPALPVDILTTENPTADSNRFLASGNKMTRGEAFDFVCEDGTLGMTVDAYPVPEALDSADWQSL